MMTYRKRIPWMLALFMILLFCGCKKEDKVADGAALLGQGQYTEAQEKFQEAVDEGENLGEAYRGIGLCLWEQEDYEGAAVSFGAALDNGAEETATIYNLLGICEMKLGRAERAAYYFGNGRVFPDAEMELLKEMAFNEIAAYEEMGDYLTARDKLEEYVQKYPDDARAAKELDFLKTQAPGEPDTDADSGAQTSGE
ncbi:MAG: tetratricopeptide repeat protein [Coprococcus sp.]|nr:tetratricopeptide repeat protein [Coprococcus sp.]